MRISTQNIACSQREREKRERDRDRDRDRDRETDRQTDRQAEKERDQLVVIFLAHHTRSFSYSLTRVPPMSCQTVTLSN